jgi:hypothetical protein
MPRYLYRVVSAQAVKLVALVLFVCAVVAVAAGAVAGAWGRTPAGNTALVVPFTVIPAIVAGGWAMLGLGGDEQDRRRLVASIIGFALSGVVLALGVVAVPLLAVGSSLPPLAGLIALAIPIVLAAPIGIALAARHDRPRPARGWGVMPLVIALLVVLVLAPTGLAPTLTPLLVPVVLVAPLGPDLGRTGALWQRIGGAILLPIVVIVALFTGMSLLAS